MNKLKAKMTRDRLVSYAFLAPSLLGVLIFYGAPYGVVVYFSLVNNPIQNVFVGFDNFARVIANHAYNQALGNTLRFSAVAVPLAVILSLFLALIMESRIPAKSVFRTMFLSPMVVPIASIVLIWQVMFNYNGLTNKILGALIGMPPVDWLKSYQAPFVILVLFLWKSLGYNMILFMSALSNIPEEMYEVASLEGADKLQLLFMIKIRYISPTIIFTALMSLINSFKVFREIYLMTGKHPHEALYMLQHYMNNMFETLDYQNLSAAAILMSLAVAAIVAVLFVIESRIGRDMEE
ncbi:carbohydrate ABC transporter permease [Butyrivibrio sp. MC2013]|uniref:carbohydrate ABC transporter permease n=1 Tax=Butyrivibrio sp. MC2013 TaxID=1280686 RepID=UPI0004208A54|nr:sugar ABC transporter permease [Butyrivibrio sp. MC2013]